MTRRGKLIFASAVVIHAIATSITVNWCMGVSMALLDSGYTQAPLSLSIMYLLSAGFQLPLTPFTDMLLSKLGYADPSLPIHNVPILINSFVAVWIIFFVVRAPGKLLHSRHV